MYLYQCLCFGLCIVLFCFFVRVRPGAGVYARGRVPVRGKEIRGKEGEGGGTFSKNMILRRRNQGPATRDCTAICIRSRLLFSRSFDT